ncbi:MAG: fimbrillin family protein [Mediterranea sp.]|jgi:hypothetical protein|nr:fimbrillin family protein [Mediterranea sp.]
MIRPYRLKLNWKSLSIALCQLSIVCACSSENEALFLAGDSATITFSAGSVREELADASGVCDTRISDNTWTTGDSVGIYMLPTDVTDLTTNDVWKNRKHTMDTFSKLNPDGDVNMLYYPLNKKSVRFVAYYPYTSAAASTHKLTVDFADQSTKEKKESKDFCFHRGTTSYTSGAPALDFKHKFCKILINVSKGAGGPSAKDIQVRLIGMPKTAEVDLNNFSQLKKDSITIDTDTVTVKAYTHSGSTDAAATVEAIVAPHSSTGKFAGRKFMFTTADGKTKTYNLPDNVTFEAGKAYTFSLKLVAGITPQSPTKVSDGMTNCYIVAPNAELNFYVSRAYMHDGTTFTDYLRVDSTATYTGMFESDIVWADNNVISGTPSVSGNGNSAVVTVKTTADTSKSGNAVVKIYKTGDANKTPVWSYHIWVTNYDPDANTFTNKDNGGVHTWVFMDRNLGAIRAGFTTNTDPFLLYQWGRKDPFPDVKNPAIGSLSRIETSSLFGTVVNTIKNPNVFYYTTSSSDYDWHYAFRDNELWGHSGTKTVYDPCPSGWRVPVNYNMSDATSPWYGFTKDNGSFTNGYNWGTNAKYAAPGYLSSTNGSLFSYNYYGYYWSASPQSIRNSNDSLYLYFDIGRVYVADYTSRSNGYSVRCVKE